MKDEVDSFCKWASQLSINWYYHFLWVWPGMFKVLKVASMQCLCNISRKNWVMNLMFGIPINMKVYWKLIVLFLTSLAWHTKINDCKGIRNLNYLVRKQTFNQVIRLNLQYPWDILRKESECCYGLNSTGCFKFYSYKFLYFCSPIVDSFPLSI